MGKFATNVTPGLPAKLSLHKETLRLLEGPESEAVHGGIAWYKTLGCKPATQTCDCGPVTS